MSDVTPGPCPRCGATLPPDPPGGHCPRCLIAFVLPPGGKETPSGPPAEAFPRRFGDYELLEEIARGGMGVVYRARQRSLHREVALKLVLAGEFAGPHARRRFQREAETAARLQHPNIVAIHEAGECDGQPYFTMDLVEGQSLSERVRDHPVPARQAARYLQAIAEAVHFAHTRGVLHRDLKPSNVLIDRFDAPRVTDFGLAQPLDGADALTVSRQMLGTPSHMAPEQVNAGPNKIGPAADVYGLGALLYHLLTGRPPFQGESLSAVLLQVQGADPIAPRQLNPGLPPDLETICLKCLEKEPGRRYRTAQEFADDLARFQRNEPVQARPLSALGRLWRVCRRRPAVTALSASVLLLLIVVAVGSTVAARRQKAANRELRQTVSRLELRQAERFFADDDAAGGVAHLAAMLRRDPSDHIAASRLVSALLHRDWALPSAPPRQHPGRVELVRISRDGRRILSASSEGTASIWEARTGSELATIQHEARLTAVDYGGDDRWVLTASADGTARISDSESGLLLVPPLRHQGPVHDAQVSLDGATVVTASADRRARIWSAYTGRLRHEVTHPSAVLLARFDSPGRRVATATESGAIGVCDVSTGRRLLEFAAHRGRVTALTFSPDDRWLVSTSGDGSAQLWNAETGEPLGLPLLRENPVAPVWHAMFSPDGALVLTSSEAGQARLWDVATQRPIGAGFVHAAGVRFGTFSPDGQTIVTASADHSARLWELSSGRSTSQPLRAGAPVVHAALSQDGRHLVVASTDGTAQVWDTERRRSLPIEFRHAQGIIAAAFSPDGDSLLTTSFDQTARRWETRSGHALGGALQHGGAVHSGQFSPDGRQVLTASGDGTAQVWDVQTGHAIGRPFRHAGPVWCARFSPDGTRVVTASADRTGRVWNVGDSEPVTPPLPHNGELLNARFSPDGRRVVTASTDRSARVWDALTGQPATAPLTHSDQVKWAEFSPDGARVVTASADDTACVWDVRRSRATAVLRHQRIVEVATFSPDGRWVLTGSLDRTARIWDADTGQALTPPLLHDSPVSQVQFSPDGLRVLTGTWTGGVRLWDARTGEPITEWLRMEGFVSSVCFDPTGRRIAAGSHSGAARVWTMPPAPLPVPPWVADFAEAVAGMRLSERGTVELLPRRLPDERVQRFLSDHEDPFYAPLIRWFLAEPAQRPPNPFE